jgi:hypothetical protein
VSEQELVEPDHPDYQGLTQSLNDLDLLTAEVGEEFDFKALVDYYVDPDSLAHVAVRRAVRAFGVSDLADLRAMEQYVQRGVALYTEAFILGAGFQEDRMKGQAHD